MTSTTPAAASARFAVQRRRLMPYLFIAPFSILFIFFLIAPVVVALGDSLFSDQTSGLGFGGVQTVFVGIGNYLKALADQQFLAGFGRVFLYALVQIPVMLVIAAAFALLFDSGLVKGVRLAQFVVFLPYAVPIVIAAVLWGFLYQPGVSPIVQGLKGIGIQVDFFAPGTVLWSIANIATWSSVGINMIIIFTALQNVPREMYEAARIDGAGEWRIAFSIKMPMIAPALLLAALTSVISTLQLFNEPQVLRAISETTVTSEYTPNMAVFSTATLGRDTNLASAMAVIVGVVTLAISLILLRVTRRRNGLADGV
jgi:multiple sugar transport system permease protein